MQHQPTRVIYNPNEPPPRQHPAQKHFEAHHLRRIPVHETDAAHRDILASSAEGRKFPQALSEFFGGLPDVQEVHIDAVPKSTHFPLGQGDWHPVTGEELNILVITIIQSDNSVDPHRFYVNASDLSHVRPQGRGFSAAETARMLVRQYPHKPGGVSTPPYAVAPDTEAAVEEVE